jgi:hypothetical protein
MALTKLGNEQGFLKAGFLGYQKSGKSYTSAKLAIGVRAFFKLDGPIAFFDTESGSGYIAEMVKAETGKDLLGVRARSFKDLMQFAQDCLAEKVSVAIVDSVTHPWRELMDSYLIQLNQRRRERNFAPLQKLEFQHWSAIKAMWEPWSEFFLNSPLHMIVCGRAGAIWEMEKNEETGRRELIQAGTKMKVEGEFGFEPSLLIEMEREQVPDGQGGFKIVHRATVLGDRFAVLDGATEVNPTFDFFRPHVEKLKPGAYAPVNTASKTQTGADVEGSGEWEREKKQRTILCEEVQGAIVSKYPGQSAEDKKQKADLLQLIFGTRSWTKVETMNSSQLRDGLGRLRKHLGIDQELSSNEAEDDLPFGPEPARKPPEVTPPQPEPESAPESPPGPANPVLVKLREVMAAQGGLDEPGLLQLLKNLGSISPEVTSLERVSVVKPNLLGVVAESWATYVTAAKDWLAEEKK